MLKDSQLDLCGRVDFARTAPLLGRDEAFSFACAGCGDCCRGREDIVLSGFDLWRIAARLRLPPQTVARAFCRASIGPVSHLPVLRLAPVKEERNNCPFLTEDHCAIHDAEPLVCALYPLAQEISREGEVRYFLQPTGCGGTVFAARVEDYLARYDVPAREKTDVRWAQSLHGAGGRGGAAGRCPRAAAAPPDAGEALAGPLFPVRLRAGLPASAGSKPRLAGRSAAKTDGVSAEKKYLSKKVMDRCTLIDN